MDKKIVLASKSPRRRELLAAIGLEFEIDISGVFEEINDVNLPAHELALSNAVGKARSVIKNHENAIIIGVDSVGAYKDHILEKPINEADAFRMIKMLQGNKHEVLTGLCLIDSSTGKETTHLESTGVEFLALTDEQINIYLSKGEYKDKAASYAIQGLASAFAKRIEGDFFNIMGLPMYRLNLMLKHFDLDLLSIVK